MAIEFMRDEIDRKKAELIEKGKTEGRPYFMPSEVKGKDGKYYYHGANAKPRRVARFESKGYEVVPENAPENWTVQIKKDGAKNYGDQVLMRIPIDKYVENKAIEEIRAERMRNDQVSQVRENLNRIARGGGLVGPHHQQTTSEEVHVGGESSEVKRRKV